MPRIVFVQTEVSQLDEPVYARLHALDPEACSVIYWNDYGFERKRKDPETGVVPDFRQDVDEFPRFWIDRSTTDHGRLLEKIRELDPRVVVLADQAQWERLRLAMALRRLGIKVGLRTDKSHFSIRARHGVLLTAERQLVKRAFDILAPVSELTSNYYAWPKSSQPLLFPYSTNEAKFAPDSKTRSGRRSAVRDTLGISQDAFVFVSATKFSPRESPWELIESFCRVAFEAYPVHLIALGDGPLLDEIKRFCVDAGLTNVSFPGFVPYRMLQDYFFAADTLLHLVEVGPWEVSPQDALVAGLGVITSERVGSTEVLLKGPLRRFLVPFGDREATAARMLELAGHVGVTELFAEARQRAQTYTVEATARRWVEAAF